LTALAIAQHAWPIHEAEFRGVGISSEEELAVEVNSIMQAPDARKTDRATGKTYYWNGASGIVVIGPGASDPGTAFLPDDGRGYFDRQPGR